LFYSKNQEIIAYTTGTLGEETGGVSYSYGDSGWKDLLISYDDQAITSDEIGNPLSYRDGMKFTWEGRQLKTAAANGKSISYSYKSDGTRVGFTYNGAAYYYATNVQGAIP
jgi:hypothetical protein